MLKVPEVARRLNMSKPTVYFYLRTGQIPGIRIGGRWRVAEEELKQLIGEQELDFSLTEEETAAEANSAGGGPTVSDEIVGRLKDEIANLTEENERLRRIVADQTLQLHGQ